MDTSDTEDTTNLVSLTLRLDRDLYRRIRILAATEEKPASQWMREALEMIATHSERKEDA